MPYVEQTLPEGLKVGLACGEVVLPVQTIRALTASRIGEIAHELAGHYERLSDYMSSGEIGFMSLEEALAYAEAKEAKARTRRIKQELTKERRAGFNSKRAQLILALIDRDGYTCQRGGCRVREDLTIDHVVPVSRGGCDDLANLRLMCRSHNSSRGARSLS